MGRILKTVPGFDQFNFEHHGISHWVLKKGAQHQPGVVILQELPGMTPHTIELAKRLNNDGFSVYLPILFGEPNSGFEPVKNLLKICVSREFSILANRKSSAITDWLRALCRLIQKQCDDVPVGAIGMCFTGGFALTLMVDESVAAPVTCQPASLDGMLGRKARSSVGATEEDLASAFARAKKDDVQLLGMRFTHDITCPAARFDYLQQQLGENFTRIDIDSSLFNPHRISIKSHSVLTLDFVDQPNHPTRQAYDQMVAFLRQRLV